MTDNKITAEQISPKPVDTVVAVKPLEWINDGLRKEKAKSIFGDYRVLHANPLGPDVMPDAWARPDGGFVGAASLEIAKAAAQTDYEARIRPALISAPDSAKKNAWHFSACDGEIVFEVYNKIVVSIDTDGVGYSINRDGDKWVSGKFDIPSQVTKAAAEIATALFEKEGNGE